jgi:hypothetical protein
MLSKVIQVIDSIAEGIVVRTDRGVRAVVKHGEVTIGTIIDEFGKIHGQPTKQVAPSVKQMESPAQVAGNILSGTPVTAKAGDITAPGPQGEANTITFPASTDGPVTTTTEIPIDPGTITVTEQPIAEPGAPVVDAPPPAPAPQPQSKGDSGAVDAAPDKVPS